jgi:hypothetical protein
MSLSKQIRYPRFINIVLSIAGRRGSSTAASFMLRAFMVLLKFVQHLFTAVHTLISF